MAEIAIVLTTVADDREAEVLARRLVDERLAACVNLHHPMVSFYRWRGEVTRDAERQLVIKTTPARLPALERRLKELHAYELPEFVVVPAGGSLEYVAWVCDQAGEPGRADSDA